jgi:hypothetical protein
MTQSNPSFFVWKTKQYGDRSIPADALYPACEVRLQMSKHSAKITDSDITEMHDWFHVVEYQANPCTTRQTMLTSEMDERWGTPNDYESEKEQIEDTYSYNKVDWLFIGFITLFFGILFTFS